MPSPLDARRLVRESAPVAAILLFWTVLSWFPAPVVGDGLRYAGFAMALLYVVVRGVELAGSIRPTAQPEDLTEIIRENVQVALSAGAWFLAALGLYAVQAVADALTNPAVRTSPVDPLAFVLTWTGVGAVLLYAIAVGHSRVHAGTADGPDATTSGDD